MVAQLNLRESPSRAMKRAWSLAEQAKRQRRDLFIFIDRGLLFEARQYADEVLGWDKAQLLDDKDVLLFYLDI